MRTTSTTWTGQVVSSTSVGETHRCTVLLLVCSRTRIAFIGKDQALPFSTAAVSLLTTK